MAPVKPMSTERTDRNTKTKPGATGFPQEYNQEAPPYQDLNPDAVTDDSVLPARQTRAAADKPARTKRSRKAR